MAPIDELPPLAYGLETIVEFAVGALRSDYERMPDPAGLLDQPFTIRELRHLHEAVAGIRLLPDTFRPIDAP
ncbi:hypothetical protein ACH3VR_03950 [Microbacterium sp. B2969]|uniref:Uncharacterized protein n=1 Tax=Microbacterium alkaliflavum TaxID=3248839 RepID=A0ABW7Q3T7_9MICO